MLVISCGKLRFGAGNDVTDWPRWRARDRSGSARTGANPQRCVLHVVGHMNRPRAIQPCLGLVGHRGVR
jgi:hypothetical protein